MYGVKAEIYLSFSRLPSPSENTEDNAPPSMLPLSSRSLRFERIDLIAVTKLSSSSPPYP